MEQRRSGSDTLISSRSLLRAAEEEQDACQAIIRPILQQLFAKWQGARHKTDFQTWMLGHVVTRYYDRSMNQDPEAPRPAHQPYASFAISQEYEVGEYLIQLKTRGPYLVVRSVHHNVR